jgi:methylated-DNA-[protein]-cysteine S-methyltransferase
LKCSDFGELSRAFSVFSKEKIMTFSEKVWAETSKIPSGRVATYGDLARRLRTNGYRAIGGALHRNPYSPKVPCHRVVGSDGKLTGFAGGLAKKQKMLEKEGVRVVEGRVDLAEFRWKH